MTDLWRLIDRMEQITDHIEEINNYLDQVHETHEAFNIWISSATETLVELQKQVKYLNSKRAPV